MFKIKCNRCGHYGDFEDFEGVFCTDASDYQCPRCQTVYSRRIDGRTKTEYTSVELLRVIESSKAVFIAHDDSKESERFFYTWAGRVIQDVRTKATRGRTLCLLDYNKSNRVLIDIKRGALPAVQGR